MSKHPQFINLRIITILQNTTAKSMLGSMMSSLMTVSPGLIPISSYPTYLLISLMALSSGLVPSSYFATSLLISFGIDMQMIIIVGGVVITILALYTFRNKKILSL